MLQLISGGWLITDNYQNSVSHNILTATSDEPPRDHLYEYTNLGITYPCFDAIRLQLVARECQHIPIHNRLLVTCWRNPKIFMVITAVTVSG